MNGGRALAGFSLTSVDSSEQETDIQQTARLGQASSTFSQDFLSPISHSSLGEHLGQYLG